MNMLLRGIAVTAAVLTVAGCRCSETAPVAPPDAGTTSAAAPSPQAAVLGTTLTVTDAAGAAAYTVGNLRPVPVDAQILPARGAMYAVDVTIDAQSVSWSTTVSTSSPVHRTTRPSPRWSER